MPASQKMFFKGRVTAERGTSATNRKVRFYCLTAAGREHLDAELAVHREMLARAGGTRVSS